MTYWQECIQWPWAKVIPIVIAAGALALGLWKYIRHERRAYFASETSNEAAPSGPRIIELLLFRWQVNLADAVPMLSAIVWAVNYTDNAMKVGSSGIPYFRLEGVVPLNAMVDQATVTLGPKTSTSLFIRYKLADSEIRAIRDGALAEIGSAEMSVSTHWKTGTASGDYFSPSPLSVFGSIVGLPSRSPHKVEP